MIRKATMDDIDIVTTLAGCLWGEHSYDELRREMCEYITGEQAAVYVALKGGVPAGFALCGLRHDYVEGSEHSPTGYLEGIYVEPTARRMGVAHELVEACEKWSADKGCKGFASDCELQNTLSQAFHAALGFSEANRIVYIVIRRQNR